MLLNILQNSQENTYVESFFNKIARALSYDPFLITPQNQTTLLHKQIREVT